VRVKEKQKLRKKMPKSCDYYISEAFFNPERTHIVSVKTHLVHDDNTSEVGVIVPRETVVQNIERGVSYMVVYLVNGKWQLGAKVEIYNHEGTKYLRTDKDATQRDNLDNLM
jgi:hypothetical protein